MRWIVGDVHGCARELDRLLRRVRFDPARDALWSVGDLVNRGPDSAAAVRLWRDAGGRGVLGNHDAYALAVRLGAERRRQGDDDLDGLREAADADALFDALSALKRLVRSDGAGGAGASGGGVSGPTVWIVHAGLHPAWDDLDAVAARLAAEPLDARTLAAEETRFVTRVRFGTPFGRMVPVDDAGRPRDPAGRPWDDFYAGEHVVVHGHWAQRGHYRGARTIGLDSGCVYGGKLTAWCPEEDRIVQVDALRR